MPVFRDAVSDTTTTTGTGTITLAGSTAVAGTRTISSAHSNADTLYYRIENSDNTEWEVGLGTYTSSGTTLSRDTILASSNSGSAVNFSAGTKNVYTVIPASFRARGTITADDPFVYSQTWNNGSVTFTGMSVDITNTASNTASSAFRVRVGGSNAISVLVTRTTNFEKIGNYSGWWGSHSEGLWVATIGSVSFGGDGGSPFLRRDAADTLALRNSTNSQTYNVYDTFASSTDYHRVAIKTARATLASVSGASVTAAGLIPDGAIVVGVTSKVTVSLGTSNGTTGYQIGDGTDADRWGAITGTTAGTSSDNTNWTATTVQAFTAATDVIVTATGGNFNGTGTIYLSVQYLIGQCD